jgi:hypothetical protein
MDGGICEFCSAKLDEDSFEGVCKGCLQLEHLEAIVETKRKQLEISEALSRYLHSLSPA